MSIKQNKLGSYLAVSAGAGCTASIATGAIQVIDLSGFSTVPGGPSVVIPGGDATPDFYLDNSANIGQLSQSTGAYLFTADIYGNEFYVPGSYYYFADAFQAGPQNFPLDTADAARWHENGLTGGDFVVGENWLPFCDTELRFGWISFTLSSLGTNGSSPVASFNHFVYDDVSTQATNAIPLETAIGAIPEASSLALLALGSVGLAARRQRRKTA